jgi:hypothetical protein
MITQLHYLQTALRRIRGGRVDTLETRGMARGKEPKDTNLKWSYGQDIRYPSNWTEPARSLITNLARYHHCRLSHRHLDPMPCRPQLSVSRPVETLQRLNGRENSVSGRAQHYNISKHRMRFPPSTVKMALPGPALLSRRKVMMEMQNRIKPARETHTTQPDSTPALNLALQGAICRPKGETVLWKRLPVLR